MADVRRDKSGKVAPTKAPVKRKRKPKVLHTLTEDERLEYENRHRLLLSKNMEYHAASNYVEVFQNALIEEYGLPQRFDLNIETGIITEREEPDAQNGRV
jgi:hypothetical protein